MLTLRPEDKYRHFGATLKAIQMRAVFALALLVSLAACYSWAPPPEIRKPELLQNPNDFTLGLLTMAIYTVFSTGEWRFAFYGC